MSPLARPRWRAISSRPRSSLTSMKPRAAPVASSTRSRARSIVRARSRSQERSRERIVSSGSAILSSGRARASASRSACTTSGEARTSRAAATSAGETSGGRGADFTGVIVPLAVRREVLGFVRTDAFCARRASAWARALTLGRLDADSMRDAAVAISARRVSGAPSVARSRQSSAASQSFLDSFSRAMRTRTLGSSATARRLTRTWTARGDGGPS